MNRIAAHPSALARRWRTGWVLAATLALTACGSTGGDDPAAPDVTPPSQVTGLATTSVTPTQVALSWSAATDSGTGVAGYEVRRDGTVVAAAVTGTSYTDTTVAPSTRYSYTVTAFDGATPRNNGAPSQALDVSTPAQPDTTAPSTPTGVTATATGPGTVNVSWSASTDTGGSGLAGYRVFRGGTQVAQVTSGTTFGDSGLTASTTYSYTVVAYDGAGNVSAASTAASATTQPSADTTAPSVPGNVAAAAQGQTSILVTWSASTDTGGSGLAGYRVFRGATQVAQQAGTSFTDTGLTAATAYTYTVRAYDGAGNVSAASASATATTAAPPDTTPPSAPANLRTTALTSTRVDLAWNAATDTGGSGVASYRVFRGGTLLTTVTSTSAADTTVTQGQSYSYTVRAVDGAGNVSPDSTALPVNVPADSVAPSVPANLRTTAVTAARVDLAWNASTDTGGSGLASYRIYRDGILLTAVVTNSGSDFAVTAGQTYSYTVRARDNAGNESADSVALSVSTPADTTAPTVPGGVSATVLSSSSIRVSWTASTDAGTGVAGYEVFRNGGASPVGTVVGTSFDDTGLTASTTYSYTVRAFDSATPRNNSALSAAVSATTSGGSGATSGLDTRPSNTTCVAVARPSASATARWTLAYPNLPAFSQPLALVRRPGDSTRWYVVEKDGRILWFNNVANVSTATVALDIRDRVVNDQFSGEQGLLGLAFHPDFANNGRIYVNYSVKGQNRSRIAEYTSTDGGNTFSVASQRTMLELAQTGADNHKGGNVMFGPDGYLYTGFGDGGGANDSYGNGQRVTTLMAKIIRIDVNRSTADATGTAPYAIPLDNPNRGNALCNVNGTGTAACPETWAMGLRNPWRWSFDSLTGELWAGDVQQDNYEEVNIITRGANYGWPIRQGKHCFPVGTATCQTAGLTDPVVEQSRDDAASITGGFVYRGTAAPNLRGRFIFSDFNTSQIGSVVAVPGGYTTEYLLRTPDYTMAMASFGEAADGELYGVSISRGLIYRVDFTVTSSNNTIPTSLRATGCIDTAAPTQPASGLIPYAPLAPFWSDGAVKSRWMGLPNGATVNPDAGDWAFPNGTVLVKSFRLGGQLIETRLFMKHPDGIWGGYTYEWNDAQTDATLVTGGKTKVIGGQTWVYPSEGQCLQCHTAAAGISLGLETAQLNGDITYPATGRVGHQITTLNTVGVLSPQVTGTPASLPRYYDPYGTNGGTLEQRARSYLHTNCSQCHRPGTPVPVYMDLRYDTPLGSTNACNVVPNNALGIANARIISPGNAAASVLVNRMNRRDANAMPPIGSTVVDAAGVQLVTDWINSLSTCN